MDKVEALHILESMPEPEFQVFFKALPERVKLCCRGGLVDWRGVLPEWYVKQAGSTPAGGYADEKIRRTESSVHQ